MGREERLRFKQSIIGFSLIANAERLRHQDALAITDSASHKPFSVPNTNLQSMGLIERNLQIIPAGLPSMVGSGVRSVIRTSEDAAIHG